MCIREEAGLRSTSRATAMAVTTQMAPLRLEMNPRLVSSPLVAVVFNFCKSISCMIVSAYSSVYTICAATHLRSFSKIQFVTKIIKKSIIIDVGFARSQATPIQLYKIIARE